MFALALVILALLAEPGQAQSAPARPPAPVVRPAPPVTAATPSLFPDEPTPTDESLGVTVYPTARFIASFDAGRGQRYYLYGATTSYTDLVAYYRTLLKQKGSPIFEAPAVYIFEIGKIR